MNSSPTTLCLRPRELATRSSLIGCTGLLAESGILRTRAGWHRQRARHAASGRGRSCATSPPPSSASRLRARAAAAAGPGQCPRSLPPVGGPLTPPARTRRRTPQAERDVHDHRHRSPRASRRHAAGLDSSTALRAGAAWPAAGSAYPAPPPTHGRSGTQDRSSGGHSVPDRRLPVSPHWTALRAGTVCLFADCSSPPPAVGPRPARIARPFAGRALCARSPGSRLLAGRRHVAGPEPPTVSGRAQCTCSPEARLLTGRRPAAGPVPPDRSPGGRRAARPPDTRLLTGRRLGSGRFRRLLSGGRQ